MCLILLTHNSTFRKTSSSSSTKQNFYCKRAPHDVPRDFLILLLVTVKADAAAEVAKCLQSQLVMQHLATSTHQMTLGVIERCNKGLLQR